MPYGSGHAFHLAWTEARGLVSGAIHHKEESVRKLIVLLVVVVMVLATAGSALASNGPAGPAPNSGDGVSDGSGFDGTNGPLGNVDGDTGPAPNSGDGIPDGSGF